MLSHSLQISTVFYLYILNFFLKLTKPYHHRQWRGRGGRVGSRWAKSLGSALIHPAPWTPLDTPLVTGPHRSLNSSCSPLGVSHLRIQRETQDQPALGRRNQIPNTGVQSRDLLLKQAPPSRLEAFLWVLTPHLLTSISECPFLVLCVFTSQPEAAKWGVLASWARWWWWWWGGREGLSWNLDTREQQGPRLEGCMREGSHLLTMCCPLRMSPPGAPSPPPPSLGVGRLPCTMLAGPGSWPQTESAFASSMHGDFQESFLVLFSFFLKYVAQIFLFFFLGL